MQDRLTSVEQLNEHLAEISMPSEEDGEDDGVE